MSKKIKFIYLTFFIYGVPIFVLASLPFFNNVYGTSGQFSSLPILFYLLVIYCLYLILFKKGVNGNERIFLIYNGLQKLFNFVFLKHLKGQPNFTPEEKVSVLFYGVKVFFTPLMIGFLIENVASLINYSNNLDVLRLIFYAILFIDTAIFSLGYLFESKKLKNVVKSVEPTALGWAVALICYPPFNDISGKIFGWYTYDFGTFSSAKLNFIFVIISLLLFSIYLWATLALGWKSSNLTNRGIVTTGPYKYVRHPAYISKNLSWWVMGIPFIIKFGPIAVLSLASWSFIYYMRAMTEERHLMSDPQYLDYMAKTKYMFIPKVF